MCNPNVRILIIAAALIVIVAAAGLISYRSISPAAPAQDAPQAYLRVQVGSEIRPLSPLADGGEYVVDQGSGVVNVIHTTATSVVMHSSTCDNQSCIEQGVVTLDNMQNRVLGGLIICLPNEVILELVPPEAAGEN